MNTKKILSMILAVMMLVSVLSFTTSATNGYEDVTVNGLKMQFGDPSDAQYANTSPEQDMHLVGDTVNNTVTVTYTGSITNYYPSELGFYVTTGKELIKSFSSDGGVTATPTIKISDTEFQTTDNVKIGFYIVRINTYNASEDNITRTLTITKTDNTTITLNFVIGQTVTGSGSGVVSYLPAPGQFVNEGISTGGWGDVYQSGSSATKNMVGALSGTGVSLGGFGGSIVLDLGENGVDNTATNPYGVDFIIYGNAFSNNAEPGCVQVAPDANQDGIPDKWYDIAGSKYYSGETVTMYYRDPTPTDNTNTTSTRAAIPYSTSVTISGSTQTWSNEQSMGTNTFHNHSWFPLARNYFDGTTRAATAYSGSSVSGAMANLSRLTPATGSNPIRVMEGQTVGSSTTNVISYSGRKIPWVNAQGTNYTFGYADVHANGSSYGTASNPYAATGTSTGGDGIDISWAVNTDGTPAGLTNIRFVRIYTGVQQVTFFGEVSTEVCGVYAATGTGDGAAQNAPTVTLAVETDTSTDYSVPVTVSNMGNTLENTIKAKASQYEDDEVFVTVTDSSADYIYINGVAATSGTSVSVPLTSGSQTIQIICQTGTRSPYITTITLN